MPESFSAFGLSFTAGFQVPGPIRAADPGLPGVELELISPERLRLEWSGSAAPKPWRGRLGDGQDLTIEWGLGGDLLFRYGDRASYLLDAARERLACAAAAPESSAWLRVLLTRVLPNISIAHGYEALHASAVATEAGAIALAARSGSGKSTLALELMRGGLPLFADDTVVLGRARDGAVEAHPSTPFVNSPDGERWLAVADAAAEPASLRAVVLLERSPGRLLGAWRMSPSPLALAPFMLGLPDHAGREASRFSLYSDLVADASLFRLTADLGHRPADLAETLLRALGRDAPAPVGSAA